MAANSRAGVGIYVDTKAYNAQARKLRQTYPDAYKAAQLALRVLLKQTLSVAAAKAPGSRIAASGKTRIRGLNGAVQFGGEAAPEAAPIENHGDGFVRHPIFIPKDELPGPPGRWTEKNSHPAFLAPAFDASREEALKILDDAIFAAMERSAGL